MREQPNRVPDLVESAKANLRELDPNGSIQKVATNDWLDELSIEYAESSPSESLPPLLLQVGSAELDALHELEADIVAVRAASGQPGQVGSFLKSGRGAARDDVRDWTAGCAELAVLAGLLSRLPASRLGIEPELPSDKPSDKRCDAKVKLSDGTWVWVEITALTISDDDSKTIDSALAKGISMGDPYRDARRLYIKVFEKTFDKPQLHPTEPSALIVVDGNPFTPGLDSVGTGWAVDEILHPGKCHDTSEASLSAFVAERYPDNEEAAVQSLASLSLLGLGGFRNGFIGWHNNASSDQSHQLTPDQMNEFTEMLEPINRSWS